MTPTPAPHLGDIIGTFILGFWAFLGQAMRGVGDFRDPATGKFSYGRLGGALAAAMVMGEIGGAIGVAKGWPPISVHALCGGFGYVGPAIALQLLRKRVLGESNNDGAPSVPPAKN